MVAVAKFEACGGRFVNLVAKTTFEDWAAEQYQNPEFVAAVKALEPGYQVTRLRIQRGLTPAELAEMLGASQTAIARLEGGQARLSLPFLQRVAGALQARVEVQLVSVEKSRPRMADLTSEQYLELSTALENAIALRESGEGGGHAALIQVLNQLGYHPMSSWEAERIAGQVLGNAKSSPD
jgi:transcriptional regulator with XRE-family HTH domain